MLIPLKHYNLYVTNTFNYNKSAFASVEISIHKRLPAQKNNATLLMFGELYEEETIRIKSNKGGYTERIEEIALDLFLEFGPIILCNLNGQYIFVIWEEDKSLLTIINDRYGLKRLFYWYSSDKILFAPEAKAILAIEDFRKEIDLEAFAQFFSMGYFFEDKTWFKYIKLLPSASVLTYQDGYMKIKKYWDFELKWDNNKINDFYIDGLYDNLKSAAERMYSQNDKFCLPLSAGLDSRRIAGFLEGRNNVTTVSYGHKHCYDVVGGRKIAEAANLGNAFLELPEDFMVLYAKEGVWLTDGEISLHNFHSFVVRDYLVTNQNIMVSGDFGGSLDEVAIRKEYLQKNLNEKSFINVLLKYQYATVFNDSELKYYLQPHIYNKIKGAQYNLVKKIISRCNSGHLGDKAYYISLTQELRRWWYHVVDVPERITLVRRPFADNNYVDFCLGLPIELRLNRKAAFELIKRYFPKLAKIPLDATGLSLDKPWWRQKMAMKMYRLKSSTIPGFSFNKICFHNKQDYAHYDKWLSKQNSEEFIKEQLKSESINLFFQINRIDRLLTQHLHGKTNEYKKITALITFSLWMDLCQKPQNLC